MVDAFVNNSRETIYLVMELIEGQDLTKFVKQYIQKNPTKVSSSGGLPENLCKSIVLQTLKILNHLHSLDVSICHRDLNPNNIMITDFASDEVKVTLIDFNVSRKFREKKVSDGISDIAYQTLHMLTQTGAPAYIAPEVSIGKDYNEKVDVWGVGCCLFYSLFGEPPFPQTE